MTDGEAAPSARARPLYSAARWQQLRARLDELADLAADAREAELVRIAATDAELAAGLRDLLADMPEVESGDSRAAPMHWASEAMPTRIGPFRLIERIGAGGMGRIYLAEREDADFVQRVALKLLDGGSARLAQLASRERRILAALAHPNITAFVDAGVHDGRAWMAMEYVQGATLLDHCRQHSLDVRARVQLFDQVCAAVAHAHAHLIVHRDLKPSNVLVGADGRAKLLDFGIALVLDDGDASAPATRVFTPEYAAPEQLRGERVTTASDVYSLGLILYEIVAGKRLSTLDRTGRDGDWTTTDLARFATTRDAADASAAIVASDTRALSRLLRGDLGRIIVRALNLQAAQRYPSVASLREDLARWCEHRPLTTGRPGSLYVLRRFVRRHRAGVALAALGLVAIVALAATALWQAHAKTQEAAAARLALRQAEATRDFMSSVFLTADPYHGKGERTTAREVLDAARLRIDRELAGEPDIAAALLLQMGEVYTSLYDRDAAKEAMAKALEYNARREAPSKIIEGSAKARLAYESHVAGAPDEALRRLAEAIALLRGEGAAARTELASALRMQGSLRFTAGDAEAVASTRESVELLHAAGPEHATEFLISVQALADMLASLERYDEALAAVERGLAHASAATPEFAAMRAELHGARGRALTGLGRHADAEADIDLAIAGSASTSGPEHGTTRYWRYRRVELLEAMGRLDDAAIEVGRLIDAPATSAENTMAPMAYVATAALVAEQRRVPTAAAEIARAQAQTCGAAGHPVFCGRMRLLAAETAIRERRTADAQALLDLCAADEAVTTHERLAPRLALLRIRLARITGRTDVALAGLELARRDPQAMPDSFSAQLDVERGYLALDANDRDAAVVALTRAREHMMRSRTQLTPEVREIDAALAIAQRQD